MLPDYPNIKKKVNSLLMNRIKDQIFRRSPILKQIRRTVQHEGSKGTYKDVDGQENQIEYRQIAASLPLIRDEMRQGGLESIMSKCDKIADTFVAEQSERLYAAIGEAAKSVGNVVDAKGNLSKGIFLESMRMIPWDFNPRTGEPQPPTIFLSPKALEKIKHYFERWEKDPEFLNEMSAIEQQQRLDWRDRESRRRLVD